MERAALRGWVKFLGLLGLALLAVPFIAQFQDPESGRTRTVSFIRPDLAPGGVAVVRTGPRPLAVYRPEGADAELIVYLPYGPTTGCSLGRDGDGWRDPCDSARYGADGERLDEGGEHLARLDYEEADDDEMRVTLP